MHIESREVFAEKKNGSKSNTRCKQMDQNVWIHINLLNFIIYTWKRFEFYINLLWNLNSWVIELKWHVHLITEPIALIPLPCWNGKWIQFAGWCELRYINKCLMEARSFARMHDSNIMLEHNIERMQFLFLFYSVSFGVQGEWLCNLHKTKDSFTMLLQT